MDFFMSYIMQKYTIEKYIYLFEKNIDFENLKKNKIKIY